LNRKLLKSSFRTLKQKFDGDYFDLNCTIYSQKLRDQFTLDEKVNVGGTEYSLVVNPKGKVATDSPESLQLLGRLFKSIQGKLKLERVGRKFFNPAKKKEYADLKLEVWPGIFFIFYHVFLGYATSVSI